MSDLDYYKSQLKQLGDNFDYPITIKLYSEHGETKHLSLNKDSLIALVDFIKEHDIIEKNIVLGN
jgi:hypothetical protein